MSLGDNQNIELISAGIDNLTNAVEWAKEASGSISLGDLAFFGKLMLRKGSAGWNCSTHLQPSPVNRPITFQTIDWTFYLACLLMSTLLILVRSRLRRPIVSLAFRLGVSMPDATKVPEAFWGMIIHSLLWLTSFYVVILSKRYFFFQRPCETWSHFVYKDNRFSTAHLPIPTDIAFIYFLQLSHYFHSVYSLAFVDERRKDFSTFVIHHIVTIGLIVMSYHQRVIQIGVLVMFIHDISDAFLHMAKLCAYFKKLHGKELPLVIHLTNLMFVIFLSSWALFRLYWFPIKILFVVTWCPFLLIGCTDRVFFWGFVALCILQILHIYWFSFGLMVVYKICTGQIKEVEDSREYESNDNANSSNGTTNGHSYPSSSNSTAPSNGSTRKMD